MIVTFRGVALIRGEVLISIWIPKGDVLVRGQCLFEVKCLLEGIRYAMRWNMASHSQFYGKSLQTETTTWSEFPNGVKAFVKQILDQKRELKKSMTVRVTVWIWVGKLTNWRRSFEVEKLQTKFTRSTRSIRIG